MTGPKGGTFFKILVALKFI